MSDSNYIVVLYANSVHEVGVVRSILESNEIMTFIQDEYTMQVMPYNNSGIGVKLLINQLDVDKAYDILKDNHLLELTNLKDWRKMDSASENLLTEWTIFGNYPPVKTALFIVVILLLILLIIFTL
ncbi:MAG: DUF2007 domain-containing protein [Bacteroidetes bacterium]|nr:DUF2007 domain-containing protein [Bacteroidota bacterium]